MPLNYKHIGPFPPRLDEVAGKRELGEQEPAVEMGVLNPVKCRKCKCRGDLC